MSCKKTKPASRSHDHLRNHNVQQNLNQYRDGYSSALIFLWEVCLTNPVLVSCPSFFRFYRVSFFFGGWGGVVGVSFSYTSHAGFIFILGVSLTHPVLVSHLSGEFSYTSHTGFPFLWGVSLTLPVLLRFCFVFVYFFVFVLSGEFLLDIPYWFLSLFFFFLFLFFKKKKKKKNSV